MARKYVEKDVENIFVNNEKKRKSEVEIERIKKVKNKSVSNKNSKKNIKAKKTVDKSTKIVRIVSIVIGILMIFSITGYAAINMIGNSFNKSSKSNLKYERFKAKANLNSDLNGAGQFADENVINILLFGMDAGLSRGSVDSKLFRPDTVMVASVNLESKEIILVSIPRDSRVNIYKRQGRDKVNSVFYYASVNNPDLKGKDLFYEGIEYLKGTASDLLGGVKIDYYVGLDMSGMVEIVDIIGGVEVDVHKTVSYKSVTVKKGKQVLNGKQFLTYLRVRNYADGDIGRVAVQQRCMKALFKQFKSTGTFLKVPQIYSKAKESIVTDLSLTQLASLGYNFKDFETDNLITYTFPGNFGNLNGISFWIIDQTERVSFLKEVYGINAKKLTQDPRSTPKENKKETTNNKSNEGTGTDTVPDGGNTTTQPPDVDEGTTTE